MRAILFGLLAVCCLVGCVAAVNFGEELEEMAFIAFKSKFGRVYGSEDEEHRRKQIFKDNVERHIPEASRLNPEATFGITQFADMTPSEFASWLQRSRREHSVKQQQQQQPLKKEEPLDKFPAALNWVERGAVSPVQSQGQCGNAAAFATIYNIEGANFVRKDLKTLIPLSVNELISCSKNGCNGGPATEYYEWLLKNTNGSVCAAGSFPPYPTPTKCHYKNCSVGAKFDKVLRLPHNEWMMTAITAVYGPLFAAVAADQWQFYHGGVLSSCVGQVDHAATIVGYNETAVPPYWLLKNSWGVSWGESGYIRILKNNDTCSITTLPLTVHIVA